MSRISYANDSIDQLFANKKLTIYDYNVSSDLYVNPVYMLGIREPVQYTYGNNINLLSVNLECYMDSSDKFEIVFPKNDCNLLLKILSEHAWHIHTMSFDSDKMQSSQSCTITMTTGGDFVFKDFSGEFSIFNKNYKVIINEKRIV